MIYRIVNDQLNIKKMVQYFVPYEANQIPQANWISKHTEYGHWLQSGSKFDKDDFPFVLDDVEKKNLIRLHAWSVDKEINILYQPSDTDRTETNPITNCQIVVPLMHLWFETVGEQVMAKLLLR